MKLSSTIWKSLTATKALQNASGDYEILFFDFLYRIVYLTGISIVDRTPKYLLYSTTVKLLLILLGVAEVWHFFTATRSIDEVIEGVNLIFIQVGTVFKYKIMIHNRKIFKSLASAMKSPNFDLSTKERKDLVKSWERKNRQSLKLLIGLGTCTLVFWLVYPLLDDLEYNLTVVISLPFDYKNPTLYPITYICTFIVFVYISYFVMLNDLTLQVYLIHLICQFAVLNNCFENIQTECKTGLTEEKLHPDYRKKYIEKYINRLGKLVDQHKFILNNTLKLRDVLSTPMLIQVAVSTTLICSISFQVATSVNVNVTKGLMSLFFLGYNMFALFIICRWCEEINTQSIKTGEALYFSGWEDGIINIPRVRTAILLILARANKPIVLSGGGMYDLSFEAYANIIKASYSALTVLLHRRGN